MSAGVLPVLGYQDKDGNYLPPYNWWADSAAAHLVEQVNRFYKGTGVQFFAQEVGQQHLMLKAS